VDFWLEFEIARAIVWFFGACKTEGCEKLYRMDFINL
jgi:hypothetical protein